MSVNRISPEDMMALSAYLDGALDPPERSSLEHRLANEPLLRAELESLRDTVNLVKSLPRLKAPRDFSLTPAMLVQTSGGSSISHTPKIIHPARFNRWQVASIATLAASILLVFIGLFAGFDNTTSDNSKANEAYFSGSSANGGSLEDSLPKATFTPSADLLGSAMPLETTMASSSVAEVPGAMNTLQPGSDEVTGGNAAVEPAPPSASESDSASPDQENQNEADDGVVEVTSVAQAPSNSPSTPIPQLSNQPSGAVESNPTIETQSYAIPPSATSQPSPAATTASATKVADGHRSDGTAATSGEPSLAPEPETDQSISDKSDDGENEFEPNVLLVIGLAGVIASVIALAYTWRKR